MTMAARNIEDRTIANRTGTMPGDARRYVLSAGRTGTVFLEGLINRFVPGTKAAHEPPEVRYQMMLANLRNDFGPGHRVLANWFRRSRKARESGVGGPYVELNPFLCAMTDLLPEPGRSLRVVHMVRAPADWARSITTFKASRRFRGIVDYVPFAKPYPSPRPNGWQQLDDYQKALWRWNWCNERIAALRDHCDAYTLVRYEDLFHGTADSRQRAVSEIFHALALGPAPVIDDAIMDERVNPAPKAARNVDPDGELARNICGPLARQFGYHD